MTPREAELLKMLKELTYVTIYLRWRYDDPEGTLSENRIIKSIELIRRMKKMKR